MRKAADRANPTPSRHQSRHASDDHSTESTSNHLGRCDQDNFRVILVEHIVGAPREPRRTMEERFLPGWATSVVQDHWTAEEVEEHLTAARTVNNE